MRYDTPIYFQKRTAGEYDAETGNYADDTIVETGPIYASVTPAGVNSLNLVYGQIREGAYVVRVQRWYTDPFDSIRIGEKICHRDFERLLRNEQVFIVSEVPS